MDAIAKQKSFAPSVNGAVAAGGNYQACQTKAGSVSLNRSMDLTITTDEGDTVTLGMASAVETNVGIYRSIYAEEGRATAARTAFFNFSSDQKVAITVAGDLNEAELKDIRDALKAVGSMISDFLSGDRPEMVKEGERLKALDTVASLETTFLYERQLFYGYQEKVQISGMAPDSSGPARSHRRGYGQRLMKRIDRLTGEMTDVVNGFGGQRHRLARLIRDLLRRYRSGEADRAPADPLSRDVVETIPSSFLQKIQTQIHSAGFSLSYTA
jgi:hypothetical protein